MNSSPSFTAKITGLEEVTKALTSSGLLERLRPDITTSLMQIHTELNKAVTDRYYVGRGGGLTNILKFKPIGSVGDTISAGLTYQETSWRTLGYFTSRTAMGNIPPLPKKRPGLVHYVKVLKGKPERFVLGKYGRGGFNIRDGGKRIMVERTGKDRYPLVAVRGITRTQMAETVWRSQAFQARQQVILNNLSKKVAKVLSGYR